ncbi:choice-of-anchor I family protein [Brachymonas chironomi]|uniref:choice-of-anchor I family protein n=1 Tax=Brachymonas chironomi TaxID=491919 RepID=UPI0003732811|nr:choice-of-anchor I family protein [Brachymonas chironomi]
MSRLTSFPRHLLLSLLAAAALAACGGDDDNTPVATPPAEATPKTLQLEKVGEYASGVYFESAAEIPAFDAASKRGFVVNAQKGAVDVIDMTDPAQPAHIGMIDATQLLAGASINSVAVHDGLVAVAVQAANKTDPGLLALYQASDLKLVGQAQVGALPDMLTFTPDGKTVLVANEAEPSDDYQTDPEGSISVVDVSTPAKPVVRTADFRAFNNQRAALLAKGVRLFGPRASVAQDLEPEYIAVSADGKTAWATLQENNAFAIIDVANARVTDIVPLGYKDHGVEGQGLDASDTDKAADIRTWPGVFGMYLPDAMAAFQAEGKTWLITANEGDARAWGEDNAAYWAGDASKGFVEEFRVKHLINAKGWSGRAGDDLPPQLNALAKGGLLNPAVFGYCGAEAGKPGECRDDNALGRLTISWTQGYQTNADGTPKLYTAAGVADPVNGDRLMYDKLYAYGTRSISIWDEKGQQVWDSGDAMEQFLASDSCKVGAARNIPCKDYFNSNHEAGDAMDNRSDNKGPEPEGVTVGRIGEKTFAFVGLERMGGVLVYDVSQPQAPVQVDYINTREDWTTKDPSTVKSGDLGPEGLAFIPAAKSPNGKPLLMVGNEVSGTTAIFQLNLTY